MTHDIKFYIAKCDEMSRMIAAMTGQNPYEAIGVSEEVYSKWKPSTRYTKLCAVIKLCKDGSVKQMKTYCQEFVWFKKFLDIATTAEKDSLLGVINDTIAKGEERKSIMNVIEMKRKELEELESKYNSL